MFMCILSFWCTRQVYGGTADQLKRYKINITPPKHTWVRVDKENNIYFKQVRGHACHSNETNITLHACTCRPVVLIVLTYCKGSFVYGVKGG